MLLIGLLSSIAAMVMAQEKSEPAKLKNPVPSDEKSLAAGKQLYQRHCAVCHGVSGNGGSGSDISPPAPSLVNGKWKHGSTDGEIFTVIKEGVPPDFNMEPWGDRLKDGEIWNVVNYIRSLAK
jgi:mono/diheme cytochrome c family protein